MKPAIGVLWAQYGPYHLARFAALKRLAGTDQVSALELASQTKDYKWQRQDQLDLITLCPNAIAETLGFFTVFSRVRQRLSRLNLDVCLLPGYSPKSSFAALLAAKSLGLRTVLMIDSHAGTAQARGVRAWIKRKLVGLFDAALVAGKPHLRYFVSLGMPEARIFTGYDAVDNDFFARRAREIRSQESEVRSQYELPPRYFLSLGRFVPKKNLSTLIRAYALLLKSEIGNRKSEIPMHFVMVGSGEEEPKLRSLCQELGLPVFDKTNLKIGKRKSAIVNPAPGVHFYGFRQIEENPVFYALAEAFILPSLYEEWGLVVNEAMACGLPVVVSEPAGCAEDLLPKGSPVGMDEALGGFPQLHNQIRDTGFVFDPHSPESLAETLQVLMSFPQLRVSMGENSRQVVEQYSCENFARNALRAAEAALAT